MKRVPAFGRLAYRWNKWLLELVFGEAVIRPGWQRSLITAICRFNLRFGVRDPELRRKLTPDFDPMCKRLVMSAGFYPAVQKPGVELVTEAIERVEPRGIVTADGDLHPADVIVLATGFDFHAYMKSMNLVGEGGLTLEQAWADGPRGYRTVAIPGFPNLFTLMGPHSPVGNHSLVAVAETQSDYILAWIDNLAGEEISHASPSPEATAEFNAEMRASMPDTIWASGCQSWYLGKDGLPELWPWTPRRHREMLAQPELEDFELTRAPNSALP
jgi:cation diffusion facilitator CzcD-associated flavoprotein CzcO